MGIKTRMVPEEYFIMELEDIGKSHDNFSNENDMKPNVHIMHPDDVETILEEISLKTLMNGIPKVAGSSLSYMGVKIYESTQVTKGKIETY